MLGVSGKYRLDQRLGGGGMAEVFLASTVGAEGFSRRVAIKRVLPGYSDNPAFAQMFVAEAQISSQLVHPNIVSVLDFDRDLANRLFLVMEFVDGRDLDALASSGPLPVPVVIFVVTEMLRGLGYAHDLPVGSGMRGIVHRDVSPHNVLLSWEGAVKVSDFGIAKARSASEATASQFIKGKPAYMSPEQANGQALDGRSDLFAVGVMLWELLVGRRLFTGEDTRTLLAAVLFGQIPRPRSIRQTIPKDVERVAMKLLERDLPARYATAERAIADLLDCADAPKNGREALIEILAARFPEHARVRQSVAKAREASRSDRSSPSPSGVPIGDAGSQAPWQADGAAGGVTPAMPSLGALRNAETRVAGRRRMRTAALLAGSVLTSGAIAFTVVRLARGGSRSTPVDAGMMTVIDAASEQPADAPAPAIAAPAPDAPTPDAGAPMSPPDGGVSGTTPDAAPEPQKDVPVTRPSETTRYGTLAVTAWPTLTVYANGRRLGDTPNSFKLHVGRHQLRLRNPETGYDEKLTITITENHTTSIDRTK